MEEEVELLEGAASMKAANSGSAWNKGTEHISSSRPSIYHSAQDVNIKESDDEGKPMMATRHDTVGSCSDKHENQVGGGGFWKCAPVVEIVTSIA